MRFDGAGQVNAQLCPLGHELLLLYDEPPRCIEVTLLGLYEHVLDVLYALLERLELLGHRVEVVLERKRTGDLNAWLAEPSRRRRSTRAPPSLSAGGARTRAALQQFFSPACSCLSVLRSGWNGGPPRRPATAPARSDSHAVLPLSTVSFMGLGPRGATIVSATRCPTGSSPAAAPPPRSRG